MSRVIEDIPISMLPAAEAALAWVNDQKGARYQLTGLVDADLTWAAESGKPTVMGLVLCDNETCVREQVSVQKLEHGFQVSAVDATELVIPPHLDPPVGVRRNWLENQLARAEFTVLVFYRGLW